MLGELVVSKYRNKIAAGGGSIAISVSKQKQTNMLECSNYNMFWENVIFLADTLPMSDKIAYYASIVHGPT